MCKSKMSVDATEPVRDPRPARTADRFLSDHSSFNTTSNSGAGVSGGGYNTTSSSSGGGYKLSLSGSSSSAAASSSHASLSSLRQSLPENPVIYDLSELRSATNNFLSTRRSSSSSSSSSWQCSLRGRDVIIFQRRFRLRRLGRDRLRDLLLALSRSHLSSIAKLLGACSSGDDIYLVYEFVTGACLSDCLRNLQNPSFTVLRTWISRMQVATDVAHALDYIHNNTGLSINLVHNHIKSSSIIVTEPNFNAKLCHFGAAQLCGETDENSVIGTGEIVEEGEPWESGKLGRSNSMVKQFEGIRGYMSPEFQANGIATQKSDIYAFGVVMLELLSGEEPLKYRYDKLKGDFIRTSIIETARAAVEGEEAEGRLRQWMDRRLGDSFPVEAAGKLIRLALECVDVNPGRRPDMSRVAGKISKLYVQSKKWADNVKVPTGISVSLAPR